MGVVVSDASLDSVFPDDLVPDLFRIVCRAWPGVGSLAPNTREDKISRKLAVRMRRGVRSAGLAVAVLSQHEVLDREDGEVIGKIDIVVMVGRDEQVYLSFESKRLNVAYPSGFRSDADKYCDRGMVRYITEQYAAGLGRGGMIGYVMDGRCNAAIKAVSSAIAQRRTPLRLQGESPFQPSSPLPSCENARDSHHKTVTERAFTIHHLLLAVETS
ncbi:MAG: hypothetical protein WBF17_05660 [Phycisphaerae bacterium]